MGGEGVGPKKLSQSLLLFLGTAKPPKLLRTHTNGAQYQGDCHAAGNNDHLKASRISIVTLQ